MNKPQSYSYPEDRYVRAMRAPFCVFTGMWLCFWLLVPVGHAQAPSQGIRIGPPADAGAVSQPAPDEFELLPIDTLFYIDNDGLTRVNAQVNSTRFKLTTDPEEVDQGDNTYLIPSEGEVTMNIAPAMHSGSGNTMKLQSVGPDESAADIIVADLLLTDRIHFVLSTEPLPGSFTLLKNYPNPFARQTTITYKIPKERTTGLPVRLVVYDVLGRRIRTLVDDRRFPGEFTVVWDGRDSQGQRIASGTYFCHLAAGPFQETVKMVHL